MSEFQFSINPFGSKPFDFVMMDGRGNKGPPSKRQKVVAELSEADRVKHEEKKRRNREAVRKHRERRRAKNTASIADSDEGSSRWDSPSGGVDVEAGENAGENGIMSPTTQITITITSSHDSIEHPAQPQALLALADAALLGHIQVHASRDGINPPGEDSSSLDYKRSVSTQTDSFKLSSPATRSVAIQTSSFGHDYRLKKCIWQNQATNHPLLS